MAFGYADVRLDFITREGAERAVEAERFDEWFASEIQEVREEVSREAFLKAIAEFTRIVDSLADVPVSVRNNIATALGERARDRSL